MRNKSWLHASVAAAVLIQSVLVLAAPGTPAADTPVTSQPDDVGDIIVTARKRNESILKVPVVETVVSAAQLQQKQITDLTDLSASVPGLNIGSAVLAVGPQISLRGVGTSSLDAGIDQSVSLNIDGLSLSQGLAYSVGIFDLAQTEVLKGPQALFFGKNSPGGAISLRSNDPGSKTEIIGRFGYEGEANEKRAELIYSTPVSDTFGIRIAGLGDWTGGFFHNKATPDIALGARAPNSIMHPTPPTSRAAPRCGSRRPISSRA
jgi:iron complex outermembrane receptor protein